MGRFTPAAAARGLLAPIAERLEQAAGRLPEGPALAVELGEVPGFYQLDGHTLVLSSALAGPGLHHPAEVRGPVPPLDRWRRAMGCVLEGLVMAAMAARAGRPPGGEWYWVGAAIDQADQAAPELGLAAPELACAVERADLGRWPRAGAAVMRAWRAEGRDPLAAALAAAGGDPPGPGAWLALGQRVLDPEAGPASSLPVPVHGAPDAPLTAPLGPWAWRRSTVAGARTGGRVIIQGPGAALPEWVPAGAQCRVLLAAAAGVCRASLGGGAPLGTWAMTSGQGFGQMMGARGLDFSFRSDGGLEILLADAFVGPLPALELAEQVGTSGVITGRWAAVGPSVIRLSALVPMGLTVHSRRDGEFAVPAPGAGLESYLKELEGSEWTWSADGDRLILRGTSFGPPVELRFKRAHNG